VSKKHKQTNALGKRFYDERMRRSWRQRDVAEHMEILHFELTGETIHIHEEMIGCWERGERNASPRYRHLLCKLFKISEEEQFSLINKDYNTWKEDATS
jgi:transcriptional regulator with XRE-family HTH domain